MRMTEQELEAYIRQYTKRMYEKQVSGKIQ